MNSTKHIPKAEIHVHLEATISPLIYVVNLQNVTM